MNMQLAQSIGPQDGDYLDLTNQWARVSITRMVLDEGKRPVYVVRGDLADPLAATKRCTTIESAVAYAFESLALYQSGRAS